MRQRPRRPLVEALEDRIVLDGSTLLQAAPNPLDLTSNRATAAGFLATANDVQLYAVSLTAGDLLTAAVDAQAIGSGLNSNLRIFDSAGIQLAANDDFTGRDSRLSFQATTTDTYYIGVSASGNNNYDPNLAPAFGQASIAIGATHGLFQLTVTLGGAPVAHAGGSVGPVLTSYTSGPSASLAAAASAPSLLNGITTATTVAGSQTDYYRLVVSADGLLRARLTASSGTTLLTLLAADGTPLVQSAGTTNSITQHLPAGTYYLAVTPLTASAQYQLAAEFTPASDPLAILSLGTTPGILVSGDFNGDGILDLATAGTTLTVLPGIGDGSYGAAVTTPSPTGQTIVKATVGDFNNDGITDLAATDSQGTLSIELGVGDGTFANPATLSLVGVTEPMVAVGDFNNDGWLDLVLGDSGNAALHVYLGAGDGTFTEAATSPLTISGDFSGTFGVGDFNHDDCLDLTTASGTVLLGAGDGTFTQISGRAVSGFNQASSIAVVDLNRDGRADLVELPANFSGSFGNPLRGNFKISYGQGDGTFAAPVTISVPGFPTQFAITDLNGDDRWDLVYRTDTTVTVLLGTGADGVDTFEAPVAYGLPLPGRARTSSFVIADVDGDGRVDVTIGQKDPAGIAVFLGAGDGVLRTNAQVPQHAGSTALVAGDFTNDGRTDLAAANRAGNDVTVNLSEGNGFFRAGVSYKSFTPAQLVEGDFNGDGRLDLATYFAFDGPFFPSFDPLTGQVIGYTGTINVFLGIGDGSFTSTVSLDLFAASPGDVHVVAADVNGDGSADLIAGKAVYVAKVTSAGLSFTPPSAFLPGNVRGAGEFTSDGRTDLLVDNAGGEAVLPGLGNGTFGAAVSVIPVSGNLVVGDFNGDTVSDLAIENSSQEHIFLGNGDGTFSVATPVTLQSGLFASYATVGDFNEDGRDDLAVAYQLTDGSLSGGPGGDRVAIFLNNGNGTFTETAQVLPVAAQPNAITTGDFNGDGRLDVATVSSVATFTDGRLTILLGRGDGTFFDPTQAAEPTERATPQVADINGDGYLDMVVLDQQGEILFRAGSADGTFGAPIVVNADVAARDITLVTDTVGGKTVVRVAALDFSGSGVSLYTLTNGTFVRSVGPTAGLLPTRIASADLNGDGRGDLVVINTGTGDLSVFLGSASGFVTQTLSLAGGPAPFDVSLADVNGDTHIDIVAANAVSGDVSVFLNAGNATFTTDLRFRADSGPYSLNGATIAARSLTAGLAVGDFNHDDKLDVLAVNRDTNTFALMLGLGGGALADPRVFQAGSKPTVAAVGYFNADDDLDVAILNEGSNELSVFAGDGMGGFTLAFTAGAGNTPAGLAAADVNRDGKTDLLVGNTFGDTLVLLGNGDGSFQPYQRANGHVSLAVFQQNNQDTVFLANQGQDRVSMQDPQGDNAPLLQRADDLLAPTLQQADVNNDGLDDLIVLNTGGNSVDVFLGTASGDFIDVGAHKPFFVGTNPSSVSVSDVNADGIPDLVVTNSGSNDVSILFGTGTVQTNGTVANWSTKIGPRLTAGSSPDSALVVDVVHYDALTKQTVSGADGIPDLVVSNQLSNSVWTIAGVGDGFFKDSAPLITAGLSGAIISAGTGAFFINQTTGEVNFIPDLAAPATHFILDGVVGIGGSGGDFNADGISDALILTADGIVDLILGETTGATIAGALNTGLDDPSEIALSAQANGLFSFYVSYVNAENVEAAVQFAIELGVLDSGSSANSLILAAVDDSALAFIAVLVSGSADASATTEAVTPTELTSTLLGLDSHVAGSEGDASPAAVARARADLRHSLDDAGSQLAADLAELGRLAQLAWTRMGAELGFTGGNTTVETLTFSLARTLQPLQRIAQEVGTTVVQAGQATLHRLGRAPSSEDGPAVPTTSAPRPDADLDLAFAGWERAEATPADELPTLALVFEETSPWSGLLPSALLAAGLATGCWLAGDRPRDPAEKPHATRS